MLMSTIKHKNNALRVDDIHVHGIKCNTGAILFVQVEKMLYANEADRADEGGHTHVSRMEFLNQLFPTFDLWCDHRTNLGEYRL